jgi:hypothetical protein
MNFWNLWLSLLIQSLICHLASLSEIPQVFKVLLMDVQIHLLQIDQKSHSLQLLHALTPIYAMFSHFQ